MLFGLQIAPVYIVLSGGLLALLLAFQILQGLRVIKFKGRTHLRVHKTVGWIMIAIAVVHIPLGLGFAYPYLFP